MRNNHPNFAAFTDIIARVECLRKADYDNETVNDMVSLDGT